MNIGALIVAAGKPAGTDPMDIIGSITAAQSIISVFRQAEIPRIAVVTGYNESLLDEHNNSLLRPVLQVSIAKEKAFMDERISLLLMLISETGSVREASERMQISYSSA